MKYSPIRECLQYLIAFKYCKKLSVYLNTLTRSRKTGKLVDVSDTLLKFYVLYQEEQTVGKKWMVTGMVLDFWNPLPREQGLVLKLGKNISEEFGEPKTNRDFFLIKFNRKSLAVFIDCVE